MAGDQRAQARQILPWCVSVGRAAGHICIFHQACTLFSFPLFCFVFLIIHPLARVVATATLSASSQTSGYVWICRDNLDVRQRGRPRSHCTRCCQYWWWCRNVPSDQWFVWTFCRLYSTSKVRPSCKSCSRQMCFCVLLKLFSHACVSPCNYAVPVIVPFFSSKLWNICRKASGVSTLFLAKKNPGEPLRLSCLSCEARVKANRILIEPSLEIQF